MLKKVSFGEVPVGTRFLEEEYLYIFEQLNEDPNDPEFEYLFEVKLPEETVVVPHDGFGSPEESYIVNNTGNGYIYDDTFVYILK